MKLKMTAFQARQLVAAWKANALWKAVADTFEDEKFFPYLVSVRVLLGAGNRLANDALWSGKEKSALLALMKYGIEMHSNQNAEQFSSVMNDVRYRDGKRRQADFRKMAA